MSTRPIRSIRSIRSIWPTWTVWTAWGERIRRRAADWTTRLIFPQAERESAIHWIRKRLHAEPEDLQSWKELRLIWVVGRYNRTLEKLEQHKDPYRGFHLRYKANHLGEQAEEAFDQCKDRIQKRIRDQRARRAIQYVTEHQGGETK